MTSRTTLVMRSMTKEEWDYEVLEVVEEMEDLVEVMDRLSTTTTDNRDTTHETVLTLPLLVGIASLTIILLRNALFFKLRCRTRDHRWVIKMLNKLVLRIAPQNKR